MTKDYGKYLLALLLLGSNGIVASYIALSSYEIVFMRTMLGSLLLLAVFLLSRGKFTFWQHKQQFVFLAISGVALGGSWIFLYEAYQQIGVSIASLAYYCGPVIVMVLSPFLFSEKLSKIKIISFLLVLLGMVLVNGQAFQEGKTGWGLFCGGMSAVLYAVMVIFNKKARWIAGLENALFQVIFSFLTVAVFWFCRQGFSLQIANSDWLPILILGLLNTGLGCYLYFSALSRLSVQTVAICGYLEPLSAVVLAALVLQEKMDLVQIGGAVLIIGGAMLGELLVSRKKTN